MVINSDPTLATKTADTSGVLLAGWRGGSRPHRRPETVAGDRSTCRRAAPYILASLVLLGLLRVWHMLALVFLVETAQSFGGPAYMALIASLVKCVFRSILNTDSNPPS